jgi:hypothetical protein
MEVVRAGFTYHFEQYRNGRLVDEWDATNIMPTQGLNHILSVVVGAGSQNNTWYVGIFEGNYTPVAGDTMATFPASATESSAYTEASRPAFVESSPSGGSTSNSASKAEFTMNATKTIYGCFLSSVATKNGTTGVLLSASKFGTAKAVDSGDVLRVTATLTLTST